MAVGDGIDWAEALPNNDTVANTIDDHTKDLRLSVRQRMAWEHEWPAVQTGTAEAGKHKFITLQSQAAAPTISGTQLAALYIKTVGSGLQELFYENEVGTSVQISDRTALLISAGAQVQAVNNLNTTSGTTTTIMPTSAPTTAGGTQCLTVDIVPLSSTNKLKIDAVVTVVPADNNNVTIALFKNTTAGAVIAVSAYNGAAQNITLPLQYFMSPGTTATQTFFIKYGGASAGTITLNPNASNGSSLTVTESKV